MSDFSAPPLAAVLQNGHGNELNAGSEHALRSCGLPRPERSLGRGEVLT
ncbi:MAG: hypothetical protein RJA70_3143 [Pseudomonadota bacterium]